MSISDPLLTTEAARILRVSPETVRLWERSGKLVAVKTASGVRLFSREAVERLARQQRHGEALSEAVAPPTR